MNNKLNELIKKYQQDPELNNLKDILDYLKNGYVCLPVTIKISAQKLIKIPNEDILMISSILNEYQSSNILPVYSYDKIEDGFIVELTIKDCFNLMKKLKNKTKIIINPSLEDSFSLDEALINYLKK